MNTAAPADRALRAVLPALAVSSVLGYGVQLVVPLVTDSSAYVGFSSFWAALFLCVSALGGIQHEVTRSIRAGGIAPSETSKTLLRFSGVVFLVAAAAAAVIGTVLAVGVLSGAAVLVIGLLVIGVASHSMLAIGTGVLYGTTRWRGVVLAILADPAVRAVAVLVTAGLAVSMSGTADLAWLMAAAALPFTVAAALVWLSARKVVGSASLDARPRRLLRNSFYTVVASTSLGLMVSGMPLLVAVLGRGSEESVIAGVVFLVVLARAPLVSPLLALQSYLSVRFMSAGPRAGRLAMKISATIAGGAALFAGAVVVAAPWLFATFVPQYTPPPGWIVATIVASAGLVSIACVTGPAVLARGGHRSYSAGWVVAGLLTLSTLLLPLPFDPALAISLTLGPVLCLIIHSLALIVVRPSEERR